MAVVANQAVAFDKSMLTACRFKPANVPIEERTTGGPHLGDVLRPGLILDHAPTGNRGCDRVRIADDPAGAASGYE
jgi:hypothetical protein